MVQLFLIRGLPGSGKSTLAKNISAYKGVHIETDMYFQTENGYRFDVNRLNEAHEWCRTSTAKLLQEGVNVFVSNTFVMKWEIQPYLDMGVIYNVKVTVLTCEGNYKNIHDVPKNVIENMKKRWEKF